MKRPVKFAPRLGAAGSFPDTPPVSARPFTSQGARANGSPQSVAKLILPRCCSEVTHPFIRALRGTSRAGAREDSRERQRPLVHGSRKRPHEYARLPLQLDDLTELHGRSCRCRRRHATIGPSHSNACWFEISPVAPHREQGARETTREGHHRHLGSPAVGDSLGPQPKGSGAGVCGPPDSPGGLHQQRLDLRMRAAHHATASLFLS